ncbi:MAG: phospho-N-acetylmuramoyl-pentapeptide-transferase [Proteobacteria bacterium]|uniref:Phospho-N-acetylmuramoyl-pentapeptide-transferase n=1 Tax=Candidatus Enterousia excrementavium TaxID=2840789 RepID=A0A940IC34_9PROT|nr:phospho-N-acetylmuramoyl-pentapeptide-transferase [Candidatus Enterousia excrementavium]
MLTSLYPEFFTSGWAQFACGFGAAFLIMLVFGRPFIRMMHRIQKRGQPISENVPVEHRKKAGTPTMGGLLIIVAIIIASLLFMPLANNDMAWVALLSLVMFGAIGFADDYKKVATQSKKASNGLSPMFRLGLEALCVVLLAYLIDSTFPDRIAELSLALPFQVFIPLGVFYYVFAYFVIAGSANAANITDGLDGMLAKLYMPVLLVLVVALYLITRAGASPAILMTEASGMYAVLGAAFGAVLGFLWFNAKPASIFMGDVGSLGLGAFMGTVAMLLRSEIILAVAAGMMVLILLSSFIQTMCFKITRKFTGTGRRVFLRAPLHHHFEELGWAETKIVERFFIASILFSGVALALLKFA